MKNFLNPEELAPTLVGWGEAKVQRSVLQLLLLGFLAGAYIGFAAHLATVVGTGDFPWIGLNRQVRIQGHVEKVSKSESLRYFTSRPRGSQIGAWVSEQSRAINSRGLLEQKVAEMKRRFKDGAIPLPDFWGGYRVVPERIEFWQGRPSRLHDRFEYVRQDDGWHIDRLQP
jgi:pyridoxamine-phosphate oxidase